MTLRPVAASNVVRLRPSYLRVRRRCERCAVGALAAASAWALGGAMIDPALVLIAVLTPLALAIVLRGSA